MSKTKITAKKNRFTISAEIDTKLIKEIEQQHDVDMIAEMERSVRKILEDLEKENV